MIGFLQGEVLEFSEGKVLLHAGGRGGVGYIVFIPQNEAYSHLRAGKAIELLIYTHVREEALDLYGFISALEKDLFLTLLTVSGIGPKSSLNILSAVEPMRLIQAITEGNVTALAGISGIGKKIAERMVVELKDRMKKKKITGPWKPLSSAPAFEDAHAALLGLGYKASQIEAVLDRLLAEEPTTTPMDVEELVRMALQKLTLRER